LTLEYPTARFLEAKQIRPQNGGVNKTIHSRQSESLRQRLASLRKAAGLTQRQLAERLKRERSLIGRLELGERRLDPVEFFWFCRACDVNPAKEAGRLMRQFETLQIKRGESLKK
jgi:transcriptional regulator with XRE-family HTH domain